MSDAAMKMEYAVCGSMLQISHRTLVANTQPRTEVRITGLDCSSGVWQFEGYGFVPNGTSGVTVAQIHGSFHGATTLILRIYDGNMRLTVFIDGEERYSTHDQGPGDLYFKCGV
ncbi:hypothetical protein NC652_014418 [Populus alba x Populus x berolinensis]|nr:hypothetical protein NC652_014418 [Populus alba x Populus x berolinensis]